MKILQNMQSDASVSVRSKYKAEALAELEKELRRAGSEERIPVLINFWYRQNVRGFLSDQERRNHFFRRLGEVWSSCDYISRWTDHLDQVFKRAKRPNLDSMMTAEEQATFVALPPTITAYRGAYPINALGFSYTLDKAVAEKFPTLQRYRIIEAPPLLLTVELPKRYCALKLEREEQEIVCVNRKAVVITDTKIIKLEETK